MKIAKKLLISFISILTILSAFALTASAAKYELLPGPPEKFKASSTIYSVTLTWEDGGQMEGQVVYQQINGKWKQIRWIDKFIGTEKMTVNNLKPNTTYKFAIKAHWGSKDSMSKTYTSVTVKTKKEVATPKVHSATAGSATLKWEAIKNAAGYNIYESVGGKWKLIGKTKTNACTIENLTASNTYKFAVRHYYIKNGKTTLGSSYGQVTAKTAAMSNIRNFFVADASEGKTTLSWDKIEGATGYRLYVKKGDGKWQTVATLGTTKYTMNEWPTFEKWYFKVRAYSKTAKGNVWGNYANCSLNIVEKPYIISHTATENSAVLTWNDVQGATGYRLYGYNQETGYYKIADIYGTDNTTYTVENLQSNTQYIFNVKAFRKADGVLTWGKVATLYKLKTAPANLQAYRASEVSEIFGGKEFYVEYSEEYAENVRVFSKLAYENGDIYLREFINGDAVEYIYSSADDCVYILDAQSKTYTVAGADSEYAYAINALVELMRIEKMGEVSARMTRHDYKDMICESFTEAEYGRYMELYFNVTNDKLEGIYTKYADGSEDTIKITEISDEADDALFVIPEGYTAA